LVRGLITLASVSFAAFYSACGPAPKTSGSPPTNGKKDSGGPPDRPDADGMIFPDAGMDAGDAGNVGRDAHNIPDANDVPEEDGGGPVFSLPRGISTYHSLPADCVNPYITVETTMEQNNSHVSTYASCRGKPGAFIQYKDGRLEHRISFQASDGVPLFHRHLPDGSWFVSMKADSESGHHGMIRLPAELGSYSFVPFDALLIDSGDPTIRFELDPFGGVAVDPVNNAIFLSTSFVNETQRIGKILRFEETENGSWRLNGRQQDMETSAVVGSGIEWVPGLGLLTMSVGTYLPPTPGNGAVDLFHYHPDRNWYDLYPEVSAGAPPPPASTVGVGAVLFAHPEIYFDPTRTLIYALELSTPPKIHGIPRPEVVGQGRSWTFSLNTEFEVRGFAHNGAYRLFVSNMDGEMRELDMAELKVKKFRLRGKDVGACDFDAGALYCYASALENENARSNPQIMKVDLDQVEVTIEDL